jgi:hypothetical protein
MSLLACAERTLLYLHAPLACVNLLLLPLMHQPDRTFSQL